MTRIAEKADECEVGECGKVKVDEVKKLAESALADAHYQKNTKKAAGKRNEEKSPLLDCLKKKDAPDKRFHSTQTCMRKLCRRMSEPCKHPDRSTEMELADPSCRLYV